jgi:hypothetical protein
VSEVEDDETVVFFRTAAWLDTDANTWRVPIHGWIYEPQNSTARRALAASSLKETYGLEVDHDTEANFSSRLNLMLADSERGKRIVVRLGDRVHTLPESGPDGHFEDVVDLPAAEAQEIARAGVITYSAETDSAGGRRFLGQVHLVPPTGVSVISDIDDTIKVTHVTDHAKLFDYTFFRDYEPVPGLPELYEGWSAANTTIHFVTSSPWQLYTPLRRFADEAGFPWASFSMKSVRFRDETLLDLFKKGSETKPKQIEPILERYPQRRFILVGDSGEHDPEVYADLFRRHPGRIEQIYIRNVTRASRGDARFREVFDGVPADRWRLFTDPADLALPPDP